MDYCHIYHFFNTLWIKSWNNIFYVSNFLYIRIYLIIILGFNLLLWLSVYIFQINANVGSDIIILHYNVDFGIDLIGNIQKIFIIPLINLIITIINLILIFNFLKHKDFKFISYLLLTSCVIINLFLLLGLVSIYLINFTG